MFFVFVSILLFFVILIGWGIIAFKVLNCEKLIRNPFLFFFGGYGILIILISYIALIRKLDYIILFFIIIIGIIYFIFFLKKIKVELSLVASISYILIILTTVFFVSISLSGRAFPTGGDTTGYHLGIVSWLNNYSLVPGLANLHFRLGNHSAYLQFSAVVDNFIWDYRSPFLMPGLFFSAYFLYLFYEIIYHFFQKHKKTNLVIWSFFYSTSLLIISSIYYFGTFNSAPNLYYDFLPMMLVVVIVNEVVKYFLSLNDKGSLTLIQFLFIINLLSAIAYLSKQSVAFIVLMTILSSLYLLYKNKILNFKNLFIIFIVPLVGFLGSVFSNLITSGYPLFPLPYFHVDFSWTSPRSLVEECYLAVKYWAKMPGPKYMTVADNDFMYWFTPWLERNMTQEVFFKKLVIIPFLGGLIMWLINIFFCIKNNKKYYWLFIANILNLLYWFFLAPDIRFGILFFGIFFSSGLAIFVLFINKRYNFYITKKLFHNRNLLTAFFSILFLVWLYNYSKTNEIINFVENFYSIEYSERKGDFDEKIMKTDNDNFMKVYIPKDQECRSVPLPCTPYFSEQIQVFNGDDLGEGFYYKE